MIIGDDEGEGQEFESHTGLQAALMLLARRDLVSFESQAPLGCGQTDEEGSAEIRKKQDDAASTAFPREKRRSYILGTDR